MAEFSVNAGRLDPTPNRQGDRTAVTSLTRYGLDNRPTIPAVRLDES